MYLTSGLVSPAHSQRGFPIHVETGPAIRPQTGHKGWSFVESVRMTIAPLMRPLCNEGEEPSAANVNLHGDSQSQVRWRSDDELLFGISGESELIVSLNFGASALFSMKTSSVLLALCGGRLVAFPW